MEDLKENFVSKTQYEELKERHQLQYENLNRKLNAVINAKEKEPTEEPEEQCVKTPVLETRVFPVQEEEPDVTDTKPTMMEAQNKYVSEKLACSSQYGGQETDLSIVRNTSDITASPWIPADNNIFSSSITPCPSNTN